MTTRFHLPTVALLMALPLAGCYSYSQTLADKPAPGTDVLIVLNDRGRVDLEQQLGPEVWQVEAKVVGADDSTISLSIQKTSTIENAETQWAGETVSVRIDDCRSVTARRFSPGRTIALAGTATVGVVAFIATRSLFGLGSGDSGPAGNGGGNSGQ